MVDVAAPTNTQDWYYPSEDVVKNAIIPDYEAVYKKAQQDPQAFWAEQAEQLVWYKKWDKVLDESNAPFYKWFVGGKTNIAYNALDRHVKTYRRNKLAIIWKVNRAISARCRTGVCGRRRISSPTCSR